MSKQEMVRRLPPISHDNQFCDTCVLAKHRCDAFLKQSKCRADKALELVHGDLCGLVKPTTLGRRRYFLLLVDDATRYMWVALLAAKSEAAVEECGRKLRVLRTDNSGEFMAAEFAAYWADEGVTRHFSALYTPQQNGVVERQNQMVVTAVYLHNWLPTKRLAGRTPYDPWHGRKPAVCHLRVFGCRVFVKQLGHVDKLADRSRAGVFIGYTEGAKAYCILDPEAR
jgi:hypothetical protein